MASLVYNFDPKRLYNSPTKEHLGKTNQQSHVQESITIKDVDDESDFDFNEKKNKILNEAEHLHEIKDSINVSK